MKEIQFNELNRNLRQLNSTICCTNKYNSLEVEAVTSGNSKTFAALTVHSLSWNLGSGASITIAVDSGTAVSFTKEGSVEFSAYNDQSIVVSAVGGTVSLIWVY